MYRKDINRDIQILTYTSLCLEGQKENKMLLLLEEVARRIKDLEEFMSGSASTELTVDTLIRISKVLKVKPVVKKEKIGPFPTEWKIFFDSSYNYCYGFDLENKGMIRINYSQKNQFDGHVSTFKGNDIDAMEVLLEDGNRLLLAALIS